MPLKKWPYARIEKEGLGTKTRSIKLKQPLPIFITYFTVFEDENHRMHFVEDEYGQDKTIWKLLEQLKKNKNYKLNNLYVERKILSVNSGMYYSQNNEEHMDRFMFWPNEVRNRRYRGRKPVK